MVKMRKNKECAVVACFVYFKRTEFNTADSIEGKEEDEKVMKRME